MVITSQITSRQFSQAFRKGNKNMNKAYSSWGALKAAIEGKMKEAMEETIDKSFEDAHKNVDEFYNSPQGRYQRTGQLAESPEMELSGLHGEIRLDTSYPYNPSGRDTMTIYNYAESGGLLGNGGFWERTEEDIQKNLESVFSKYFNQ